MWATLIYVSLALNCPVGFFSLPPPMFTEQLHFDFFLSSQFSMPQSDHFLENQLLFVWSQEPKELCTFVPLIDRLI